MVELLLGALIGAALMFIGGMACAVLSGEIEEVDVHHD